MTLIYNANMLKRILNNKLLNILISGVLITFLSLSCNRGTGCPAEEANTRVDKNGYPKGKTKSGLYDKKGRMNSNGYKTDRRKSKKHTN